MSALPSTFAILFSSSSLSPSSFSACVHKNTLHILFQYHVPCHVMLVNSVWSVCWFGIYLDRARQWGELMFLSPLETGGGVVGVVLPALRYLYSPPVSAVPCCAQLQHGGGPTTARGRGRSSLELDHWLPPH